MIGDDKVIAKEYHQNGNLKFVYTEFNRDDVDHIEINVKRYYKNGQLKKEEGWLFGNSYGSEWYETGQIKRDYEDWIDPISNGTCKEWSKCGKLIFESSYCDNDSANCVKSHSISWYLSGNIKEEEDYCQSRKVSRWSPDGKTKSIVQYNSRGKLTSSKYVDVNRVEISEDVFGKRFFLS
jgi:antitoxin component YwqK of YwqJK toxin-antitoxin module